MSEISICIPTYEFKGDGVKYLSELFDTLRVQTFQDFNIVVSDHSVDDEIHDFALGNATATLDKLEQSGRSVGWEYLDPSSYNEWPETRQSGGPTKWSEPGSRVSRVEFKKK